MTLQVTTPQVMTETNLAYGPDPRHQLDLYHPVRANGAIIVCLHGGGWWQGDKSKEEALATRLAQAGYLVAVPNYRFANGQTGANLYPTQVCDVLAAIDWLIANGRAEAGQSFGAFGASSGGNLALEVAIARGVPAACWSGLLDLSGFIARHGDATPHQVIIDDATPSGQIDQGGVDPGYYKWLLFNLLGPGLERLDQASPVGRISQATGPVLMANSMTELVPPEEPVNVAVALVAAGVPARVLLYEGSRHGEAYLEDALPETLRFFAHYLTG
ncbi:MAG: alpha/beta hydrolase [Bifidobacteriaceae bacterium]|nr:alpha/beta hydrolase [Bifidobacteriaceae bacterium]